VLSAQFNSAGTLLLTTATDKQARLWDLSTETAISTFPNDYIQTDPFPNPRFSPQGDWLATLDSKTALVWNLEEKTAPFRIFKHAFDVVSCDFSRDGKLMVTAAMDNTAQIWNVETGEPAAPPIHHDHYVLSVQFHPKDHALVTSSRDKTARVQEVETGFPLTEPIWEASQIFVARFSPDGGRLATVSKSDRVQLWDVRSGELPVLALSHVSDVRHVTFSPDGQKVATASWDGTGRIWDARTGQMLIPPLRHSDCLYKSFSVQFSPDGGKAATAAGNAAQIWNVQTGRPMFEAFKHDDRVNGVRFSPDGRRLVTACYDGTVRIWDVATGQPLSEPLRHEARAQYAEFSPDGKFVVSCSTDKTARIWEVPMIPSRIPDWLPELAEAVAGQRIDEEGISTVVPVDRLFQLKQTLTQHDSQDYYKVWARWFFADSATRTISPLCPVTVPELRDQLAKQRTQNEIRRQARQHQEHGRELAKQKSWIQAVAEYTQAIELDPVYAPSYLWRGDAHLRSGNVEKAKADFDQGIALSADAQLLNRLAWQYVAGPVDARFLEHALPLAQKAAELTRNRYNELNTLGVAHCRLGQWAQCVETLDKAIAANPAGGTAIDFYFLAMSYHRLGETLKAQNYFAKATSWTTKRSDLSARWQRELAAFRAEAEEVLGIASTEGQSEGNEENE
jgi:WD40 repeat protein/tetratricopeptide (TPR) repeat protein